MDEDLVPSPQVEQEDIVKGKILLLVLLVVLGLQ
jgi:hypothetical protein